MARAAVLGRNRESRARTAASVYTPWLPEVSGPGPGAAVPFMRQVKERP